MTFMKKRISVIVILVILFIAAVVFFINISRPKVPPVRTGTSGIADSLLDAPSEFPALIESADAVAVIEIKNWLGEDSRNGMTFFDANTIKVYKGELPDKFVLIQEGCQEWIVRNYPLFTYGNQMLLFLKSCTIDNYKNTYYINGEFTSIFDVSYDADGKTYFLYRSLGVLNETIKAENYGQIPSTKKTLTEKLFEQDKLLKEYYLYDYIYDEADIISLIS